MHPLSGVYAASITPLKSDFSPDTDAIPGYLDFLASRGCHGALLLGTTGEGPSFSPDERLAIYHAALEVRQKHPDFRLLAGTGTPSLAETVSLTRSAFDKGFDAVVVLPPYYYRNAPEAGLFCWYEEVIRQAIPADGVLLGYHIPAVSGVPLSLDLLTRLKESFPARFSGLKDSSGDANLAKELGDHFGFDLMVLSGSDRLFSLALACGASGCITAAANLVSPLLRTIWDAHQQGESRPEVQERLTQIRTGMDRFPPAPALLKVLLAHHHGFPLWPVRPPLLPFSSQQRAAAIQEISLD
jgi:4-hydroxy-tetrahydrodipicolinate synthase